MLGRKKGPTVATAEDSWAVYKGTRDGDLLLVRIQTTLRLARDRASYPIQIGVALPILTATGYPSPEENLELQDIEELVINEAGDRAVWVAALTVRGVRELVFYCSSGEWIAEFHQRLQSLVSSHEVQCMAQSDPDWSTYFAFLPAENP
jgi:hypothetical protein